MTRSFVVLLTLLTLVACEPDEPWTTPGSDVGGGSDTSGGGGDTGGGGGESWNTAIAPIVGTCTTVGCHTADSATRQDLTTADGWIANQAGIRQRVDAKLMPPFAGDSWTQTEIDTVLAWVDGGANP